jgi:uncharacterized membrane protein YfcA
VIAEAASFSRSAHLIQYGGNRMTDIVKLLLLGLVAGGLSGLIGIGGGIVIVPALIFLFGFTQQQAQGTTLALLVPPIGILAAWTYYRQGFVNVQAAALIAAGFVIGSLLGARWATGLTNEALGRLFGVVLIAIGVKMVFGR